MKIKITRQQLEEAIGALPYSVEYKRWNAPIGAIPAHAKDYRLDDFEIDVDTPNCIDKKDGRLKGPEDYIIKFCDELKAKMLDKYRRGAKEHGDAWQEVDCWKEIGMEILDILVYFNGIHKAQNQ